MKQNDICKEIIKEETRYSDGFEYKYYLTSTKSRRVASYKLPLYSIRIEMTGGDKHTEHELKELFADAGKAITFFDELVKNLATPLDLPYILEDKIMI